MLNKENQSIAAELLSQTADPELMFKQLDDYLANWIGLMQENEHLKENERLKTEHIKALTEACRCILLFHTIIGESTLIKMKSNNEIFILFTCDESKSYASMKCIAASTDIEVIYMAIGKCILNGDMEYRGLTKQEGYELYIESHKNGSINLRLLDYGFVQTMDNLTENGMRTWKMV